MGDLLNIAIRSSGVLVPPTLNVNLAFSGGQTGNTAVIKNGVTVATLTFNGDTESVPIVSGDTYQVTVNSTSGAAFHTYINGSSVDFSDTDFTITSAIRTAGSNQTILINTECFTAS